MKIIIIHLSLAVFITACSSKRSLNNLPSPINEPQEVILQLNGESDSNKAGKLRTANFDFDSSSLDDSAMSVLKENAEYMKLNKLITIQIEGHCDERGGRQYNLALGERRATSVRNYMRTLGINPDRMKTISLGNERPLSTVDTEKSRAKNRRANFIILSK